MDLKKVFKGKTGQIMIALLLGVIAGCLLKLGSDIKFISDIIVGGFLQFFGSGFINLIKMTVVPLVFFSLVCGISSFGDIKQLGRIGGKVILFFMLSTAVAVAVAILFGIIFHPGSGLDMSSMVQGDYTIPESQPLVQTFLDMLPTNPIAAMAEGNMLQVIVFSVFVGLAFSLMGKKAEKLVDLFELLNDCVMKIVEMVMFFAPIGVFSLIANTVFNVGLDSLVSIAKFVAVVAIAMLLHAFVIYGGVLKTAGLKVRPFMKSYSKVAGVTFSTASSNAALPFSMESMEELGVGRSIYSFALPLGATINMNGTAIMQGVAVVFIAQVFGIDLSIGSYLTVILTAVLASIGTAGVPGVGMITLSMVLQSAGLPLEGIALIIGFDRILDMMRTTVNVMGDCVCSVFVAKTEKELDMNKYNAVIEK